MEKKKLSVWAKEQNMPYKKAWLLADAGELPAKIERNKAGSIFVLEESKASVKKTVEFGTPTFADKKEESIASVRRNRAATETPTNQYAHIENGLEVFSIGERSKNNRDGNYNDTVSPSEAIRLVRKAYWNFSDLMNIINVMTEFSTSKIFLRGGNAKSRKFYEDWMERIGILNFQGKFFLEYYRSCNVFPYRYEAVLKDSDVDSVNKTYGAKAAKNVKVPVKYVIIDPASVIVGGNINFSSPQFFQRLNSYEVQRLTKPVTEEDVNFRESLPEDVQEKLNGKVNGNLLIDIPLDPKYCYFIFYKKADYEPMAVPMAWPVLKDINWKAEMKALDMAVARTTQRAILVVTMGYESKNGEYMFDAKAAEAMRALFDSESVGKVLVADFTTKVEWKIPDISQLLGKEKYEQVNEDIRTGLNNILAGSNEKFANQSIKVKLFIQRLIQSREAFLNEFFIPEMKRIGKDMGFRSIPTPHFEDLDFKDEDLWNRIVTQLTQMGVLTSWEATEAMETGVLPDKEQSIESQKEFKKLKDDGLFQAVQVNPAPQKEVLDTTNKHAIKMQDKQNEHDDKQKTKDRKHAAENPQAPAPQIVLNTSKPKQPVGKPTGTKSPNTKKKTKPISASLVKERFASAVSLNKNLESTILAKYNLEKLNPQHESLKDILLESIMMSESPENWTSETIAAYIANPDKKNEERFNKVIELGREHQVNDYLAAILFASQKDEDENEEIEVEQDA